MAVSSPDLTQFLARADLAQHAHSLTALGHGQPEALLALGEDDLFEAAAQAGLQGPEISRFMQHVRKERDQLSSSQLSSGGQLARALAGRNRVEKLEGTGLDVVKVPFKQPAALELEYDFEFPAGVEPRVHRSSLRVLEADFEPSFVDKMVTREAVVLVVGESGSGKSTHVDAMVNYAMGITLEDPYRFKLAGETVGTAASQTDAVTAYKIPAIKGSRANANLTVIDTPGFCDTRGQHVDMKIVDQITKMFQEEGGMARHVASLTSVCFVIKASETWTVSHEYVWNSVLSLFGKDMAQNIFVCLTFANGQTPPVRKVIDNFKMPCAAVFEFSNSALCNSRSSLDDLFWKMWMRSMDDFFERLACVEPRSLRLSREVLSERAVLEEALECLGPTLRPLRCAVKSLRNELEAIELLEKAQVASKDFQVETTVWRSCRRAKPGRITTTCMECQYTCNTDSCVSEDSEKFKCSVMTPDGRCRICPKKCSWEKHRNVPYFIEWYQDTETTTLEDLKQRYQQATDDIVTRSEALNRVTQDLLEAEKKSAEHIKTVKKCRERLAEIALRDNTMPSVQYFDMLMQNERTGQNTGYEGRISVLMGLRERRELSHDREVKVFLTRQVVRPMNDMVKRNARELLQMFSDAVHP